VRAQKKQDRLKRDIVVLYGILFLYVTLVYVMKKGAADKARLLPQNRCA
jgi:tetrahydromethanopterin S-methyltransferase subunit G